MFGKKFGFGSVNKESCQMITNITIILTLISRFGIKKVRVNLLDRIRVAFEAGMDPGTIF